MCATYRIFTDEDNDEIRRIIEEVTKNIGRDAASDMFKKDIYPSMQAPVIMPDDLIVVASWGFPIRSSKSVVFNARSESILEKPMFSRHMKSGRCLIPSTGFYEWDKTGIKKFRVMIRPEVPGLFYFAGIISAMPGQTDTQLPSFFTIITTAANSQLEAIHNRMPVILHSGGEKAWLDKGLDPRDALKLLVPYDGELKISA